MNISKAKLPYPSEEARLPAVVPGALRCLIAVAETGVESAGIVVIVAAEFDFEFGIGD